MKLEDKEYRGSRRDILHDLRSDNFARTAPRCKSIENNDLVGVDNIVEFVLAEIT